MRLNALVAGSYTLTNGDSGRTWSPPHSRSWDGLAYPSPHYRSSRTGRPPCGPAKLGAPLRPAFESCRDVRNAIALLFYISRTALRAYGEGRTKLVEPLTVYREYPLEMRTWTKIDPSTLARQRWSEGMKITDLVAFYGVHKATILRHLRKAKTFNKGSTLIKRSFA